MLITIKPNSVKELTKIIKKEWKKLDNILLKLVISMKNHVSSAFI